MRHGWKTVEIADQIFLHPFISTGFILSTVYLYRNRCTLEFLQISTIGFPVFIVSLDSIHCAPRLVRRVREKNPIIVCNWHAFRWNHHPQSHDTLYNPSETSNIHEKTSFACLPRSVFVFWISFPEIARFEKHAQHVWRSNPVCQEAISE